MVFLSKKAARASDYTVADILGKPEKKGTVGLEIELEGRGFRRDPVAPWTYHQDGSLRGADNAEYVFVRPMEFNEVDKALDDLWAMFKGDNTRLDETNRTSVHVHLNVLPFYQNRLTALMSLWFIVEDVLTHWCGESRVGNHYCLRAKDSPAVVHQLKRYVRTNGDVIPRENFHYAAFNANAIAKFGSVEIRTLRGVNDPTVIKTWVKILKVLYEASEQYSDPRFLIEEFSLRGAVEFFEHLFGDLANEIIASAKLNRDQLQVMLYEGMRNAQDISYARDWSDFKPQKVARDPFGRKEKEAPPRLDGGVAQNTGAGTLRDLDFQLERGMVRNARGPFGRPARGGPIPPAPPARPRTARPVDAIEWDEFINRNQRLDELINRNQQDVEGQ